MHIYRMTPVGLLVMVLLLACAALWYGARGVRRQKGPPRWAAGLDQHRALVAAVLGLAVLILIGFGAVALLAPLLSAG